MNPSLTQVIVTVLTFSVAFSFREFLTALILYWIPNADHKKLLYLGFITLLMFTLTLGFTHLFQRNDNPRIWEEA